MAGGNQLVTWSGNIMNLAFNALDHSAMLGVGYWCG